MAVVFLSMSVEQVHETRWAEPKAAVEPVSWHPPAETAALVCAASAPPQGTQSPGPILTEDDILVC